MTGPIVIAAGGTGGHLFPAEALASVLARRGHTLVLMTDARNARPPDGLWRDHPHHVLPGSGIAGKGMSAKIRGGFALLRGTLAARKILGGLNAKAVIGFGGYPSIPPLLGAHLLTRSKRPPLILHEGNAILGQANALLARFATAIATSYPQVARLPAGARTVVTGMPVRAGIEALATEPYLPPDDEIRLLVWGGSLGARVFSDVVPAALAALPPSLRARLRVTQQVRAEDHDALLDAYRKAGIRAQAAPFLSDVPALLKTAHLVIGRGGGSSVAEIVMAGRPSILVPLPIAASDEQGANGAALQKEGAAWMIRQPDFTPAALTARLESLLASPQALADAAQAASRLRRPHAAEKLADLVESVLQP